MSCPSIDELAALSRLDHAQRAELLDHAADCTACFHIVADMLPLASTLASTTGGGGGEPTAVPARLGRYEVEARIGAGAMGVVYAARDPELDRRVAIKLVRPGASTERLRAEARALAKLAHPNIVAVHDVGTCGAETFIAMALVDGENLRAWASSPRTCAEVVHAIREAARGIAAVHAAGIVHRDIKPDNIFIARTGEILVGDFGLARDQEGATRSRELHGTPAYMAPEHLAAGEATPASDQYSLCVTAWELLYGARPFAALTPGELEAAIRRGPPPQPKGTHVPAHVHAAIARGLAADPAQRHGSLAQLASALAPPRRRWPFIASALGVVAIAASVAIVVARRDAPTIAPLAACTGVRTAPLAWTPALRGLVAATDGKTLSSRLATGLDCHAERWTQLIDATCAAHASGALGTPAATATLRCLERRAAQFALVAQRAPTLSFREADTLVAELPTVEDCANAPSVGNTPELRALQAELDAQPVTRTPTDKLVARATALGDPATLALAHLVVGRAHLLEQRTEPALAELRSAADLADRVRDDRTRATAEALLASRFANMGRSADAEAHRDRARVAAERSGDTTSLIAVEQANASLARMPPRNRDAEVAALRRSVELLGGRCAADRPRYAATGALAYTLDLFGLPDAPAVMATTKQLGAELGKPDSWQSARDAAELVPVSESLPLYQRALSFAPTDIERLALLRTIALLHEMAYDYAAASDTLVRAIALVDGMRDATPAERSEVLVELLESLTSTTLELAISSDTPARKALLLDQSLAAITRRIALGGDLDAAGSFHGRILLERGDFTGARPLLLAALARAEADPARPPYRIAVRAFNVARVLWETGGAQDRDRSRALATQARDELARAEAMFASKPETASQVTKVTQAAALVVAWQRTHP